MRRKSNIKKNYKLKSSRKNKSLKKTRIKTSKRKTNRRKTSKRKTNRRKTNRRKTYRRKNLRKFIRGGGAYTTSPIRRTTARAIITLSHYQLYFIITSIWFNFFGEAPPIGER